MAVPQGLHTKHVLPDSTGTGLRALVRHRHLVPLVKLGTAQHARALRHAHHSRTT